LRSKISILNHFDKKEAKKMDRNTQLDLLLLEKHYTFRIIEDNVDKNRVGVIWGSGIGGLETFETEVLGWANSNGNS
jgi:3-oxoacyl-[acyl-carrier-protein] synthase II